MGYGLFMTAGVRTQGEELQGPGLTGRWGMETMENIPEAQFVGIPLPV